MSINTLFFTYTIFTQLRAHSDADTYNTPNHGQYSITGTLHKRLEIISHTFCTKGPPSRTMGHQRTSPQFMRPLLSHFLTILPILTQSVVLATNVPFISLPFRPPRHMYVCPHRRREHVQEKWQNVWNQ